LEEFEKPELLDEENKWYCPNCKDHVQATKTLQMYKAPLVLVISLKRFKHGKSRYQSMGYGYSSGGGKLSTHVDFPIDGLDLKSYILHKSTEDGQHYIYDLFGISNHYGGLGGGHYTAFAKNWRDNKWYNYDDSSCSNASSRNLVTDAAYNLFYRRREVVNLNEIDYNGLKQSANMSDLE
jgi:ubiquitin carboxyl-terminal hydrolase 4/11/15